MLKYKNFVPRQIKDYGFFSDGDFANFDDAVAAADQWIRSNEVEIVQIETVVLPNMYNSGEKGPNDTYLRVPDQYTNHWHQFLRVWYRK